jgi:hypothetical protein
LHISTNADWGEELMDIVKENCFPPFPWAETIMIAFGVAMVVLAWRSMRQARPPAWAKAGRRGAVA